MKCRVVVLLWPLVLWSMVDGMAKYLTGTPVEGAPLTLVQVFILWAPTTGIFRFLWSLFFLSLMAFAVAQLTRALHLAAMAVLGLIGAGPFESLWSAFIHMPEFFAGIAVATLGARGRFLKRRLLWPGIALFPAGQGLLALGLPQVSRVWAEIALGLATLGFVLWISNLRPPAVLAQHLSRLGQLTLPIYLTHILFTAATMIALDRAGIDSLALHLAAGTTLGLVGPVALYLLARRLGMTAVVGFEHAPRRTALATSWKAPWPVR
jgi:peptidoglycan/LPS O-acetylase OafA/YrhL